MTLPEKTSKQIESLNIIKNKPLIISDVDEVLVHFAKPLEEFLANFDMNISFTSYKLFGNVHCNNSNEQIAKERVYELLRLFFMEAVHTCPPVDGVNKALSSLAQDNQIIILTNTPFEAKDLRIKALQNIGINYQLVANDGHKGLAVKAIANAAQAPTVFIDDIPHHHSSVAKEASDVHRIHFVADDRLAKLLPPATHCHQRIDSWGKTHDYIKKHLLSVV